jgi:hypothetical protein
MKGEVEDDLHEMRSPTRKERKPIPPKKMEGNAVDDGTHDDNRAKFTKGASSLKGPGLCAVDDAEKEPSNPAWFESGEALGSWSL